MEKGMLKQNDVHLKDHEYQTVRFLLNQGYDIELIPPSNIKGLKMPDLMMQGIPWEMKSPEGNGKRTIQNTIQNATHQSGNIIIDLSRIKMDQNKAIKELKIHFDLSKRIRRLKIITKDKIILDFAK